MDYPCDASKWRLGTATVVPGLPPLVLDVVVPARHSLSVLRSTRTLLRNPSPGSCWSHCWCVPHYMWSQALDLSPLSLLYKHYSFSSPTRLVFRFFLCDSRSVHATSLGVLRQRDRHRLIAIRTGLGPRLHNLN